MIDALRMEVYSSVFNEKLENCREVLAEIIGENSFSEYLEKSNVYFLGDGAEKCKELITHKNAKFIDAKFPSAKEMAGLSYVKYKKNDIEDVAYFEPFYLKDFVVTSSKK
jgi:tRNA threonylcarbamoyladenosine biosynthesis protein TsaB